MLKSMFIFLSIKVMVYMIESSDMLGYSNIDLMTHVLLDIVYFIVGSICVYSVLKILGGERYI